MGVQNIHYKWMRFGCHEIFFNKGGTNLFRIIAFFRGYGTCIQSMVSWV